MCTNSMAVAVMCALSLPFAALAAASVDSVVLVHGTPGARKDFARTVRELKRRGCLGSQIHGPHWGYRTCPACNDHQGTEEESARSLARFQARDGRMDVIAHSMGATLLARQVGKFASASTLDVGIAGAFGGGACGAWGLSEGSPLLHGLDTRRPAGPA